MNHPKRGFAYVVGVEGAKVTAVISQTAATVTDDGTEISDSASLNDIQIGALVKIPTSKSHAYGIITSLSMSEPKAGLLTGTETRMVRIDLLGEAMHNQTQNGKIKFLRGISVYPALGGDVHLASNEDLAQIYARPSEPSVRIGAIHQDATIPAYVLSDKMLGMHFAVLGTTGSGKSCTVALLIRSILTSYPQGRILLLDPHSEYSKAFGDIGETITTETLDLPYWVFNAEESIAMFIDKTSETHERETAILKDAILHSKRLYHRHEPSLAVSLTVDSPVPYQMSDALQYIQEKMGELEQPDGIGPYLRLRTKINQMKNDPRFAFMFPGLTVHDTFEEIISSLMRLPVAGKPITIFDISGVPSEVVDVVVSLMCRLIFDFAVWSREIASAPILLMCEEAHRYIPQDTATGFAPTRRLIMRIAQEGRKYGISLGLITQRPSLISETILSQCNTLFALRMSNERDQAFIKRAIPETAFGLMNALPALRTQEAVISGEGVTLPMRVRFATLKPEHLPKSETQSFSARWARDDWTKEKVHQVVERWRRQQRHGSAEEQLAARTVQDSFRPASKPAPAAHAAAPKPTGGIFTADGKPITILKKPPSAV